MNSVDLGFIDTLTKIWWLVQIIINIFLVFSNDLETYFGLLL